MTSFRFRLQKVLDLRRTQLEVEEIKLKQAAAEVATHDLALQKLRAAAGNEESQLRSGQPTIGLDWAALGSYRLNVKKGAQEIENQRAESVKKLAAQQAAILEARRRCHLLDRLKERRLAEFTAAQNKELDETAADSYLAQWNRRRTAPPDASIDGASV